MTENRQRTFKECNPIEIATLAFTAVRAYPVIKQIIKDLKGKE